MNPTTNQPDHNPTNSRRAVFTRVFPLDRRRRKMSETSENPRGTRPRHIASLVLGIIILFLGWNTLTTPSVPEGVLGGGVIAFVPAVIALALAMGKKPKLE